MRALPEDPFTRSPGTWVLVMSDDPEQTGVRDVRSGAEGLAKSGVPFSEL